MIPLAPLLSESAKKAEGNRMAGTTYQVRPGAPQQLTGTSVPANSVIVNNDSTNSIWISSVQNMGPGNGLEVSPFAVATWTGGQLWACVDTGVVLPVRVTVSSDVSNVDDPVAVATAVATALLAQGIPTVLIEEQIYTGSLAPAAGTGNIDCSKYSSLIISFNNQLLAVSQDVAILFFDASGVEVGRNWVRVALGAGTIANMPSVTVPVVGVSFGLININGVALGSIFIDGTNRPTSRFQLVTQNQLIQFLTNTETPFVVGTNYNIGSVVCNGEPMTFELQIANSTVVKGVFSLIDTLGDQIDITDTTEMHLPPNGSQAIRFDMNVPVGYYILQFACRTTGGNAVINARMIGGAV